MLRATRICGGEVELPAGVVTQPLLEDKSRESGLKLCDRFPLGLFHKHGVVAEYKLLVERIEEMLSASGQTKERKRAQKELFWKNYMRNSKELDMYASTMEVFTITMDFFIEFESAGLSISVCHRSRLAPESHQPLMEQWIEFVDKSYAPRDYKSQWSVASTFFMPICICFGTADLLRVVLPSVSVVKLLPERFPSSDIVLTIPSRVRSLLSLKMATAQYERFAAEVVSLPRKRFGHYDLEAVSVVVARHRDAFRRLGLDVFLCKLFTMAAEHRLFAWLEFVDLSVLPSYTPQYHFSPHLNAIADAKVLHRDSRTGERYVVTAHTRHLRRLQRHARNKRRLFCQKGPPTFWIDDQV
ncbi:Hypothetical Protein FCC1311_012682 [Hondaea fermentalgiana]|uniref:Uncharacterized protein n=1 Tax=Hondaea fermentalgiana TaxID=2315210 RepID=A0A2R5GAE5_9STRA|nr:Hypothetical Protein FCC1311_012682 [Hondaea fermentalgiana]|eukprot:GBG25051.1 Hypothetical Protein FCC1311_012682 [Hondaea fermentalgiana]